MDGDPDFFVAKLDTAGNTIWARSGSNRYGYSVCTNVNGDVFVLGNYNAGTMTVGTYTFFNPTVSGGYGNFLVSYDSNGNIKWAKGFGGQANNYAYSIAADVSNIYITGFFYPFNNPIVFDSYTLTPQAGSTDPMYFVRMDFSGNVVYAIGLKSGGNGSANQDVGVCTDTFGNVYIGSDFNVDPFVIGAQTLTLSGMRDVFLAKFHFDDVGINENTSSANKSFVYPNPANDQFMVHLPFEYKGKSVEINIFDITGKLIIKEKKIVASDTELRLKSTLLDGLYLLKVFFEDGTYDTHHLIISK